MADRACLARHPDLRWPCLRPEGHPGDHQHAEGKTWPRETSPRRHVFGEDLRGRVLFTILTLDAATHFAAADLLRELWQEVERLRAKLEEEGGPRG